MSPSAEYPFGRHAATPLAVALQGAALLGTLVYGAADAITVLLAGGSEAAAGSVLAYGVVSALASLLVVLLLRRAGRVSALVQAEVVSWRAGTLLSLVVAIGGGVALAMVASGMHGPAALVDPILVLIACAGITCPSDWSATGSANCLKPPRRRDCGPGSPRPSQPGWPTPSIRIERRPCGNRSSAPPNSARGSMWRSTWSCPRGQWQVDEEDAIRLAITRRLDGLGLLVWATVALTTVPVPTGD